MLPCGQCLICRITRRRKWTARLLLEHQCHKEACFITLTYGDWSLPPDQCVSKRELQLFFKRLRKLIDPKQIRYYACGEYGKKFGRPHYHAIIFGLPPTKGTYDLIVNAWQSRGRIDVAYCEKNSMQYVAGYVAKKYTKDDYKENNRTPEFALMSRRPALGSGALDYLAQHAFAQNPFDVLSVIEYQGKQFPLDRTLREKLRRIVMTDKQIEMAKKANIEIMQENLLEMIAEELGEDEMNYFERIDFEEDKFDYAFVENSMEMAYAAYAKKYEEQAQARARLWNRLDRRGEKLE